LQLEPVSLPQFTASLLQRVLLYADSSIKVALQASIPREVVQSTSYYNLECRLVGKFCESEFRKTPKTPKKRKYDDRLQT
jgi:hypothetical protein